MDKIIVTYCNRFFVLNYQNLLFLDPLVGLCIFISVFRKIPPFKTKFFEAINHFNEIFAFLDESIVEHEKQNDYRALIEPRDFIDAFLMEKTKLDKEGKTHHFS